MKSFRYGSPKSIEQVTAYLAGAEGDVRLMAGGTDLLGEIKEETIAPDVVVDLKAVPGLAYLRRDADGLAIGACATVADLAADADVARDYKALHEAAAVVASPQLRNMGTVGGNLCQRPRCWYYRDAATVCNKKGGSQCFAEQGRNKYHAIFGGGLCWSVYPSDLAPALIALDARIVLASAQGERTVPLAEFYAPPIVNVRKENVLAKGEVVREVRLPAPRKGDRSAYVKFMERGAWDFAVASAAVKLTLAGSSIADARIVCGGVAPVPWRLRAAEEALRGRSASESAASSAAAKAAADARPLAENGYKVDIFKAVVARAIVAAAK